MGEMITFKRPDGKEAPGYEARPAGVDAAPGIVVIQEWWGLVPHVTGLADRFAEAGFVALAPDLYHGVSTGEPDEAMRLMMGLAMDSAAQDISGAAQYLFEHDASNGSGTGVVGFCMGGGLAMLSATQNPGKVFTREMLLSRVWGYEYYGGARTVDVHVRRLRAKLGEEHANLIQTVRSVGYRFGQSRWGS